MKYNDNSNWYVMAEAGSEPVTIEELKALLNMNFAGSGNYGDDDDLLTSLIPVCREIIEHYCGISIKAKTIQAIVRNECGGVDLPFGPVVSIASALDINGNTVSLTTLGDKWRSIFEPTLDYIKVTYTVGFQAIGYNATPKALRQAILEEAAWRYLNRGTAEGLGSTQAKALCSPYKRKTWLM